MIRLSPTARYVLYYERGGGFWAASEANSPKGYVSFNLGMLMCDEEKPTYILIPFGTDPNKERDESE